MSHEWLIIGGGIHGVHLAARLIGEAQVPGERIAIVDPSPRLLSRWRTLTERTGMSHLRSPSVHNLDLDPGALKRFANVQKHLTVAPFEPPYSRPSLELFNAHCDDVIARYGLADLHIRDYVVNCVPSRNGVRSQLAKGGWVESPQVVFAIGTSNQPHFPRWAPRSARVQHIFETGFNGWPTRSHESVTVIGGGISAAQVALRLVDEGHQVRLVTRHSFREHRFDSDPGWLGPKYMNGFEQTKNHAARRELIRNARHRGSVPPYVNRRLQDAIEENQISWSEQAIEELTPADDRVLIRDQDGNVVESERVLLATGFEPKRPGGSLIDSLIDSARLTCAPCGYPIPDASLRWHPGIYVAGPLAELELGPTARNIAGARAAADRIIETLPRIHTRTTLYGANFAQPFTSRRQPPPAHQPPQDRKTKHAHG